MNALALLTEAFEAGIRVTVDGARLVLEGEALTEGIVASFKEAKPEILQLMRAVPDGPPAPEPDHMPTEHIPPAEAPACDDCGKRATALIVTDYGCRYCRDCLRPAPLALRPRTRGLQ
jgi:hypothetical protein